MCMETKYLNTFSTYRYTLNLQSLRPSQIYVRFFGLKGTVHSVQPERGGGVKKQVSVKSLWIRTQFPMYFIKSFCKAKLRVWWLPIKVLSGSRKADWRDVLLIHKILPAKKTKKLVIHCKKRVPFFPSKAGMSLTKLSLWLVIIKIFPARDSLVTSDIPAGDGKYDNLFNSVCELYVTRSVYQINKNGRRFDKMLHFFSVSVVWEPKDLPLSRSKIS